MLCLAVFTVESAASQSCWTLLQRLKPTLFVLVVIVLFLTNNPPPPNPPVHRPPQSPRNYN